MDYQPSHDDKECCRLARAYVPSQPYCRQFPLNVALMKGTIFTCLHFPFPEKEKDKR